MRKWKIVLYLGRDPLTKKHQQKAKRFSGAYSEAKNEMTRLIKEAASSSAGYPSRN